jgi:hypothetical protein
MTYTKSITFDEEDLNNAAAAGVPAFTSADEAFLEDLKSGNAQAFDTLINRYSSDVYGLLFRLTQDAEEAADLAQETFIKALRSIGSFRGDAELKTWLFRIAIRNAKSRPLVETPKAGTHGLDRRYRWRFRHACRRDIVVRVGRPGRIADETRKPKGH